MWRILLEASKKNNSLCFCNCYQVVLSPPAGPKQERMKPLESDHKGSQPSVEAELVKTKRDLRQNDGISEPLTPALLEA